MKVSAEAVEIFLDLDRVAVHARAKGSVGERIIKNEHLPENSRAYLEATPQMLLAQARFSHPDLHALTVTAKQVLNRLLEFKMIQRTGAGRATRYRRR